MKRRRGRPDSYEGRQGIALGLAIAGATLPPGATRTQEELAAYAGCTRQQISQIERKALRKIRLNFDAETLSDLYESIT